MSTVCMTMKTLSIVSANLIWACFLLADFLSCNRIGQERWNEYNRKSWLYVFGSTLGDVLCDFNTDLDAPQILAVG